MEHPYEGNRSEAGFCFSTVVGHMIRISYGRCLHKFFIDNIGELESVTYPQLWNFLDECKVSPKRA